MIRRYNPSDVYAIGVGHLADRIGGARVTLWNFVVMFVASLAVFGFLPSGSSAGDAGSFFWAFVVLFLTTGVGNGSVFRMVPSVFLAIHMLRAKGKGEEAMASAKRCAVSAGRLRYPRATPTPPTYNSPGAPIGTGCRRSSRT